jgi:HAD superfamily hydrolase (TIGR01490 family)
METVVRKSYVAFFDLDKTILNINSGSILVREAHKRGLMSTPAFLNAVLFSLLYKFHLRDTTRIITGMGKWLCGKSQNAVQSLSETIVSEFLIEAIRPGILSEIKKHKDNNAALVILSSAIIEICTPIKKHLGFDDVICTSMEVNKGVYTGRPEDSYCFDEEKGVRLKNYCDIMNYELNQAFYYGDSIADAKAMRLVGNPNCVSPDKELLEISLKNGWNII